MKSGHKIPHLAAIRSSDVLNCGKNPLACRRNKRKIVICFDTNRCWPLSTDPGAIPPLYRRCQASLAPSCLPWPQSQPRLMADIYLDNIVALDE
jgi:hypothetical protein